MLFGIAAHSTCAAGLNNQTGVHMHPDRIKGNWKQLKGNVKRLWGEITFNELGVAAGKSDCLYGQIQESNGIAMEKARLQRLARGNSHQETGSTLDTPGIELYNSPNLETYSGSVSSILLNLRNERHK